MIMLQPLQKLQRLKNRRPRTEKGGGYDVIEAIAIGQNRCANVAVFVTATER